MFVFFHSLINLLRSSEKKLSTAPAVAFLTDPVYYLSKRTCDDESKCVTGRNITLCKKETLMIHDKTSLKSVFGFYMPIQL